MKFSFLAIALAAALLVFAGCETAPQDEGVLVQARSAVAQAEANPNVTKYAATELDRARKLLINAEGAANDKAAGNGTAAHYAYLATQMARISEQRAHEQAAIERIRNGEVDRQKILLGAREGEAQRAQAAAEQARSEAANAQSQAAQSEAERQRLAAQLEDMQAAQTERGIVLTLGDVLFDTGRAELKPGAARAIDQITAFLNEYPERNVQIEGFTDSDGTNDYNLELSQQRADAVAMAILRRGIDAERVRALGYGEEFPVASNANEGSRQLNRRVEVIVSRDRQSIPGRALKGTP
jgi:outer membrane protein OmpA-like peptidoglycan-associated protein